MIPMSSLSVRQPVVVVTTVLAMAMVVLVPGVIIQPVNSFTCRPTKIIGVRPLPLRTNHDGAPSSSSTFTTKTTTALFGVKRGSLYRNISPDDTSSSSKKKKKKDDFKLTPTTRNKKRKGSKQSRKKKKGDEVAVSPLLAQWAAESSSKKGEDGDGGAGASSDSSEDDTVATASVATFSAFDIEEEEDEWQQQQQEQTRGTTKQQTRKGKNSQRRVKQAERKASEKLLRTKSRSVVATLEELCSEKVRDIPALLGQIRILVEECGTITPGGGEIIGGGSGLTSTVRNLSSSPKKKDYKLTYAGSDDAVCHFCTGLHKVPLARLQEVFVTFGGNKVEVQEVVRVIGPFPNVKNVLQGDLRVAKNKKVAGVGAPMKITYTSMIDGTGKEVMAGKEENVRTVDLDVLFASEEAMICHCVNRDDDDDDDDNDNDPYANDGEKLLVFLKEEDLQGQLEVLRVG